MQQLKNMAKLPVIWKINCLYIIKKASSSKGLFFIEKILCLKMNKLDFQIVILTRTEKIIPQTHQKKEVLV